MAALSASPPREPSSRAAGSVHQDGDLVYRATATEALPALVNLLNQQAG
ncbi:MULTISPECIES: hypothetical protein [Streptomyces]|nr:MULTISPECIES: hypothetical protein [Streptomyces]MDP9950463.1 hypothetical protein [Streptomyces sp. DSM 41269]